MPELPEAEAARRLLDSRLVGASLRSVKVAQDEIVCQSEPDEIAARLQDAEVIGTGRKGKTFWLELKDRGIAIMHLGMSGSIVDCTRGADYAVDYKAEKGRGTAKDGRPKYLKLWLEADDAKIAMADPRRLARIRLADSPEDDEKIQALGPDAFENLPEDLYSLMEKRRTPIKALLLNQGFLSGIGNWIADEVLYHAGIRPDKQAPKLSRKESKALREAIEMVLTKACAANADHRKFPDDWLFHVRWGGGKGAETHLGEELRRDTIGGRTTAWVPGRQR